MPLDIEYITHLENMPVSGGVAVAELAALKDTHRFNILPAYNVDVDLILPKDAKYHGRQRYLQALPHVDPILLGTLSFEPTWICSRKGWSGSEFQRSTQTSSNRAYIACGCF